MKTQEGAVEVARESKAMVRSGRRVVTCSIRSGLEDLHAPVGQARPAEEGDAVALSEEITGRPRG